MTYPPQNEDVTTVYLKVRPSRRRERCFRLASAALGVLIALFILEVASRIFLYRYAQFIDRLNEEVARQWGGPLTLRDVARTSSNPARVYELWPGARGTFAGQPLEINSGGFRDREWAVEKSPSTVRIAILGDSVAFGWGVPVEKRYSNVLEQLLTHDPPTTGVAYECLNFAVPGYNTVQELATLREVVLRYSPDVVIVNLVDNDDEVPNFIRLRPQWWSLRQSFLVEAIRDRLVGRPLGDTARLLFGGIVQAGGRGHGEHVRGFRPELVPPEYRFLVGWENMVQALHGIHDECTSRGIAAVCVIHYTDLSPLLAAERPTAAENNPMAAWKKAAEDAGFVVCDPAEVLIRYLRQNGAGAKALWLSEKDPHPNEVGHRLIAQALAQTLKPLLAPTNSVRVSSNGGNAASH
ncbi:MAG: hypothetical protein D6691_06420 [Candidatus Hydrogenedentota bacterium]|uniref:SGNH hydrolase-type esterase domain-containing protein n=1 Tax=Sumerlaea chitinivorans TaxID=2250252 RepID=A0A2Z4Y517_SUMC1|nr:hypothetical protein BRCON_1201 [Candidatus Sumerlaea chitinivorans]MCX7964609.1 GDSL-type esterase/lipase family protein [Candidatus Sumerlaea chitinivorans]RMH27289.1 MAG: hypothetical protein D6691_06420 [Candidatus Hydrogenedentota bacterium]